MWNDKRKRIKTLLVKAIFVIKQKEKIMNAKQIAQYVWENGDWYELRDNYDSYEELLEDVERSLRERAKRKELLRWLKENSYELL